MAEMCLVALKLKKRNPPSLVELHARIWNVKRMKYLTASLNNSLSTCKPGLGTMGPFENSPYLKLPRSLWVGCVGLFLFLAELCGWWSPLHPFFLSFPHFSRLLFLLDIWYSDYWLVSSYLHAIKTFLWIPTPCFPSWMQAWWHSPVNVPLVVNLLSALVRGSFLVLLLCCLCAGNFLSSTTWMLCMLKN